MENWKKEFKAWLEKRLNKLNLQYLDDNFNLYCKELVHSYGEYGIYTYEIKAHDHKNGWSEVYTVETLL